MYKNMNKGFTLIELLIVIAIIGVLAATVVVSLGDQTENAREGSVKIGVAGIASLARIEVDTSRTGFSGDDLCDTVYPNVAGEDKGTWTWQSANICGANDANVGAEICCSSDANAWVVWGNVSGTGTISGDVYCADSTGHRGIITLTADNAAASTKVSDGRAQDNPTTCQ